MPSDVLTKHLIDCIGVLTAALTGGVISLLVH
jgi:hypothetical protein